MRYSKRRDTDDHHALRDPGHRCSSQARRTTGTPQGGPVFRHPTICPLSRPHRRAARRASDQLDAPGSLSSPGTPPCAHRLLFDHRPVRTQSNACTHSRRPVAGNCSIAVATAILQFLSRPVAPGPAARCAEPGGLCQLCRRARREQETGHQRRARPSIVPTGRFGAAPAQHVTPPPRSAAAGRGGGPGLRKLCLVSAARNSIADHVDRVDHLVRHRGEGCRPGLPPGERPGWPARHHRTRPG